MSLDVIYGEPRHRGLALELAKVLKSITTEGTIYLGYPVLAMADERVFVDALMMSEKHGLVAFQIADATPDSDDTWKNIVTEQDRLFSRLESQLLQHDRLRSGRKLAFTIETVTVFADSVNPPGNVAGRYCSLSEIVDVVNSFSDLAPDLVRALQAVIQRVTTIKPAKRRTDVTRSDSRGSILKQIEKKIANLDRWQKTAAIETPDGPQRIRGLAGSGKTIVLALKAAYLHAQHPEWRIALCFQSRSLYQQLEDLVTRFSFEHSNDKPDSDKLQILHAWGATNRNGMYKTIANHMGATFRDFNYASNIFGRDEAFGGACSELLTIASQSDDPPIYDAVLIDEAQDLPPSFFQLVYRFTKNPRRIVWAFDELQTLSEAAMPTTRELFGTLQGDTSLVSLANIEGEARRDIVLPICYRNSPWALATAHALGFGVYRQGGLVQCFDDVELWNQIGYSVVRGELVAGKSVELERSKSSYPEYFGDLLGIDDAVMVQHFASELEQDSWVAEQIKINLSDDELEHDDILIVLPDAYTSKRRAGRFSSVLIRLGIQSHLVGISSSQDQVFVPDSIAIAHIYRAKGNEAPIVYVLDSQYAAGKVNAVTRRNTIFTAVTRSRAWVRICGWGDDRSIINEVREVKNKNFHLDFRIPTTEELARLRRVHSDRSEAEVKKIERVKRSLVEVFEVLDAGELELSDLPANLRTRLKPLLPKGFSDESDN